MLHSLRDQRLFGLYCIFAGVLAFAVSLIFGAIIELGLETFASQPDAIPRRNHNVVHPLFWISAIVFAPLVETVIFRWLLKLLFKFMRQPLALGAASVLAGIAHGPYVTTFFATTAAFFVYATAWNHWRHVSLPKSYWAPALAHGIANALILAIALAEA